MFFYAIKCSALLKRSSLNSLDWKEIIVLLLKETLHHFCEVCFWTLLIRSRIHPFPYIEHPTYWTDNLIANRINVAPLHLANLGGDKAICGSGYLVLVFSNIFIVSKIRLTHSQFDSTPPQSGYSLMVNTIQNQIFFLRYPLFRNIDNPHKLAEDASASIVA